MATIVDGHQIAEQVYERIRAKLATHHTQALLGVVLVGDHKPSRLYVEKKRIAAENLGIGFRLWEFPSAISEQELCEQMVRIQKENALSGLIVQLPLPNGIDTARVVNQITPEIDVDFLSDAALGKLVSGSALGEPPTPGAIMEILRHYDVGLKGAVVTIVGAGRLVGRPLANMMMNAEATISVVNQSTPDLQYYTEASDIVVSATGVSGVIDGSMIKEGCVVIDAGISVEDGVTSGDIDFESVKEKASIVTPTPGGVGPITVAKLLENTIQRF